MDRLRGCGARCPRGGGSRCPTAACGRRRGRGSRSRGGSASTRRGTRWCRGTRSACARSESRNRLPNLRVLWPPTHFSSMRSTMSAQPPGAVLGDGELQAGVAVEDAAPQQHPQRPGRPPPGLGGVDRHHARAGQDVLGRAARVHVDDEAELLGRRPDRLVDRVVVRRLVAPEGGDHHRPQAGVGHPVHLGHGGVDVVEDRHGGHAAAALRAGRAQLGQPAVVGAGAGHDQLAVELARALEPGAERRRGAAAEHVGVGEDHLGRRCPPCRARRRGWWGRTRRACRRRRSPPPTPRGTSPAPRRRPRG